MNRAACTRTGATGNATAEMDACWDDLLATVGQGGLAAGVAWVQRRHRRHGTDGLRAGAIPASRWLPPPATLLRRLLKRQVTLLPPVPGDPGGGAAGDPSGAVLFGGGEQGGGVVLPARVTDMAEPSASLDSPTVFECLRVPLQLDVLLLLRALHRLLTPRDVCQFVASLLSPPCALNRWVEAAALDLGEEFALLQLMSEGSAGTDDAANGGQLSPPHAAVAWLTTPAGGSSQNTCTDAMEDDVADAMEDDVADDIIPGWLRARATKGSRAMADDARIRTGVDASRSTVATTGDPPTALADEGVAMTAISGANAGAEAGVKGAGATCAPTGGSGPEVEPRAARSGSVPAAIHEQATGHRSACEQHLTDPPLVARPSTRPPAVAGQPMEVMLAARAHDRSTMEKLVALFGTGRRPRGPPLHSTALAPCTGSICAAGGPMIAYVAPGAAGAASAPMPRCTLDWPLDWNGPALQWDDGGGTSSDCDDDSGDGDNSGMSGDAGIEVAQPGGGDLGVLPVDGEGRAERDVLGRGGEQDRVTLASASVHGGKSGDGGPLGVEGVAASARHGKDDFLGPSKGGCRSVPTELADEGGRKQGTRTETPGYVGPQRNGGRKRGPDENGEADRQAGRSAPSLRPAAPHGVAFPLVSPVDTARLAVVPAPVYPAAWTGLRDALHALLSAHTTETTDLPPDVDLLVSLPAPQQAALLSLCQLACLDDALVQRLCQRLLLERADVGYLSSVTFLSATLLPKLRALGGEGEDNGSGGAVSRALVAALLAVGQRHPEALVEAVLGPTVLLPTSANDKSHKHAASLCAIAGETGRVGGEPGGLSAVQCDLIVRCVRNAFPPSAAGNLLRFLLVASLQGRGTLDVVSLSLSQAQGQGQDQGVPLLWSEPVVTLVQVIVDEALDVAYFQVQGDLLGRLMAALGEVVLQPQVPPMLKFGNFLLKVVSRLGPLMAPSHRATMERVLMSTTTFIKKSALKKLAAL